jgi:glycosyltransferase involved in cell wall biosynthesis
MRNRKAAHFLLIPELLYSPPNNAIINAYLENDYQVDIYTPGEIVEANAYGPSVRVFGVDYSWSWIIRGLMKRSWYSYEVISGTSEDPLLIVGLISELYRKKSICLVDEIKSGAYRGDRSDLWKGLCKRAIKRSQLRIVNDETRVNLLQEYANVEVHKDILVYPGCYYDRPEKSISIRQKYRNHWGFNEDDFVIASSGGFNMTAGAEWLLQYLKSNTQVCSVIQPLGVTPLSMYLLKNFESKGKIYIQENRMSWSEAWESAQAFDAGLCIYKNQAPQFQHMGISSNRLCMFLAMGVPVIATKQKSFEFIEEYNCGVLVDNYKEFSNSIEVIKENLSVMRLNCEKCFHEYIRPKERFNRLSMYIHDQLRK